MSCEEGIAVGRYFLSANRCAEVNRKPQDCSSNLSLHKAVLDTSHSSDCDSSCQTRGMEDQQAPGGPGERRGREGQGEGRERTLQEERAPGGPVEKRRGEEEGAEDDLDLHSSCFSSCHPEEEEEESYSDWSEEDLSLHFSPSIILPSDEESDRETGETQSKEKEEPMGKGGVEVLASQLLSQSVCHRPVTFLRQHSMPACYQQRLATSDEEAPRGYRGLVTAARQEPLGAGGNNKPRFQKSISLDETKTKLASCLIKTVLSKKMQGERGPAQYGSALIPNPPKPLNQQYSPNHQNPQNRLNPHNPPNQPMYRHGAGGTGLGHSGPVHVVRDIKSQVQTAGRLSFTNTSSTATTTHSRAIGSNHMTYKVIGVEVSPPPSYQQAVGVKGHKGTKEARRGHPVAQGHATLATALPQSQNKTEGSRFRYGSPPTKTQAAANQAWQLGALTEGAGQGSNRVGGTILQQGSEASDQSPPNPSCRPPLPAYYYTPPVLTGYTPTLLKGYAQPPDLPHTPAMVPSSASHPEGRGGSEGDDYKGFISTSAQSTSTHNVTHELEQTQLHQHQLLQQQQYVCALQPFWPGGGLVGMTTAGRSLSTVTPTQHQLKTLFDPETGQYVEVLLPLANYTTTMAPVGPAPSMIHLNYTPITLGPTPIQVGSTPSMIPVSSAPLHLGSGSSLIPVGCRVMSYHPMPALTSHYPPFTVHTHTHSAQ